MSDTEDLFNRTPDELKVWRAELVDIYDEALRKKKQQGGEEGGTKSRSRKPKDRGPTPEAALELEEALECPEELVPADASE